MREKPFYTSERSDYVMAPVGCPSVSNFLCAQTLPTDTIGTILNRKGNVAQKYNSQFSLHLHNKIEYICNDEILVQR